MPSTSNTVYIVLLVVAAALMLPFLTCTGWFFYDGTVTYPERKQMWDEYDQIRRDYPNNPDAQARLWVEHASTKGWPTNTPVKTTDQDILTQYILGSICSLFSLAAGVTALVFGLLLRRDKSRATTASI